MTNQEPEAAKGSLYEKIIKAYGKDNSVRDNVLLRKRLANYPELLKFVFPKTRAG